MLKASQKHLFCFPFGDLEKGWVSIENPICPCPVRYRKISFSNWKPFALNKKYEVILLVTRCKFLVENSLYFQQEKSDLGTETQRGVFNILFYLSREDIIFQSTQDIVKFIHQETKHISSRERFLTSLISTIQWLINWYTAYFKIIRNLWSSVSKLCSFTGKLRNCLLKFIALCHFCCCLDN